MLNLVRYTRHLGEGNGSVLNPPGTLPARMDFVPKCALDDKKICGPGKVCPAAPGYR